MSTVLVVVPALDEEDLLPACLTALDAATSATTLDTRVVVAVGPCRDRTPVIAARHPGVTSVRVPDRSVGRARALAADAILRQLVADGHDLSATWIASTDADSTVPLDWLLEHVRHADAGVDLLLGTVDLPESGDEVEHRWRHRYTHAIKDQSHPHIHGANLGVRATTYCAAGGFASVTAHEDVLLVDAVRALPGTRCASTTRAPVLTSPRRAGRTPTGVAHDLRRIAAG